MTIAFRMPSRIAVTRTLGPALLLACLAAAAVPLAGPAWALSNTYLQTNLVSDVPGLALTVDPQLRNPWGLSFSATSPIWVSDNVTGVSTIYTEAGAVKSPLVVTIPTSAGTGISHPTGQVFNATNDFLLSNGLKSNFIFAALDGSISAWNTGTAAAITATVPGAAFTGLAMGSDATGNFLYAANFAAGTIEVFNSSFQHTSLSGGFQDPTLPAGFSPFNVQNVGGQLFVTYADGQDLHDATPGKGFVDVFDTNGNFMRRLASQGSLNSPWGVAMAPGSFGAFSNDLLVGNFGDGFINAFDPNSGSFLGQLRTEADQRIQIDGLWGLAFGNGAKAGPTTTLLFTAGPQGEQHGLLGAIQAVPEPRGTALMLLGLLPLAFALRKNRGTA